MKQLALVMLFLPTFFAKGQEVVFGDTAVIRDIQGKCSIIYDTRDKTDFLLTQTRLPKNANSGSNLVVYSTL